MDLFRGKSTYEYKREVVQRIYEQILALPDSEIEAYDSDHIRRIRSQADVEVPKLNFEKRTGKRRSEERYIEQFGERVRTKVDFVDVFIPFTGEGRLFALSPSRQTLGTRGKVQGSSIVLSLVDDERLERDLESMFKQIEDNIGQTATDLATLEKEVTEAIKNAIAQRTADIARKRDLDSKRSFKIE